MRERLALVAAVSTVVLVLTLSSSTRAQQERRRAAGDQAQNPAAAQDRNQKSSAAETIRGVVAAITAEGEAMFDYRSNRAVAAEAAFLTVVGSPMKSDGDAKDRARATENERQGASAKKRHNVYIVWLTPRTKILASSAGSEKSSQTQGQNQAQKREVAFDQLEVGDHVEIQFARHDESGASNSAHQTEQMRGKHGRHRTFVGDATLITIVPPRDRDQASSRGEAKSNERAPQ